MKPLDYLRLVASGRWLKARAMEPSVGVDNVFSVFFRVRIAVGLGDIATMMALMPRLLPLAEQLPAATKLVAIVKEELAKAPARLPGPSGTSHDPSRVGTGRFEAAWNQWREAGIGELSSERRVTLFKLALRLGEFEAALEYSHSPDGKDKARPLDTDLMNKCKQSLAEAQRIQGLSLPQLPLPIAKQLARRMRESPREMTLELTSLITSWGEFSGDWSMAAQLLQRTGLNTLMAPEVVPRLLGLVSSAEFAAAKLPDSALQELTLACRTAKLPEVVAALEAQLPSLQPVASSSMVATLRRPPPAAPGREPENRLGCRTASAPMGPPLGLKTGGTAKPKSKSKAKPEGRAVALVPTPGHSRSPSAS